MTDLLQKQKVIFQLS